MGRGRKPPKSYSRIGERQGKAKNAGRAGCSGVKREPTAGCGLCFLPCGPKAAARVSPNERAKQPLAFDRNSGHRGEPSSRLAPGARPGRAGSPGGSPGRAGQGRGTPALLPVCAPSLGGGASSSSAASPLLLLLLLLPTHPHTLPRPSSPALRSGVLLQPVQLLREEVFQLFQK